jgi:DNA repair exonuclease SbcCD nuclease subunit
MSEIKFITFTDIHISDVNPSSRTGSYRDDILAKLEMIGKLGKKVGVDFFVCAGDVYNLKAPMRNSHQLNNKLIDVFREFPAPVLMIEGNHDLTKDSYENFDKQPISVLYKSKAVTRLTGKEIEVLSKDKKASIMVRGFPFVEEPDLSDLDKYPTANKEADFTACALHLYATPGGGNLFKTKLFSYEEVSQLEDDIFVFGHYHVDQGVEKISNQSFINVGAVSRGSLSHDNVTRTPKVCLVTCSKDGNKKDIKTQVVRLKVRPAAEAFIIEEKEKENKKMKEAEAFVEHLKEAVSQDEGIEDAEGFVNKLKDDEVNVEKEVLSRVEHYINEADFALKDIKK